VATLNSAIIIKPAHSTFDLSRCHFFGTLEQCCAARYNDAAPPDLILMQRSTSHGAGRRVRKENFMRIDSSSISILNQLNKTTKNLSKTFQQLSTGKSVNSAGDNPSALALSNALESATRSLATVNRGIDTSMGALDTASGGLSAQLESLQQARELAVQAANGTLSDNDRANLQQQYNSSLQNVDQISSQTNFNGNNLLDGSYSKNIATGPNGETTNVSIGNTSSNSLGISSSKISDQSSAQDAIASIDSAISQVVSQQAKIGASQSSLESQTNANSIQQENLAAAKSNLVDADYAELVSKYKQQQTQLAAQLYTAKAQRESLKSYSKSVFSTKG
jgi:flagellin